MEPTKNKANTDLSSPVPRKRQKTAPPKESIIRQLLEQYPPSVEPEVEFIKVVKPEIPVIDLTEDSEETPVEIEPEETFVHPPQYFYQVNSDGTIVAGWKYFHRVRAFQEIDEYINS